MKFQKMTCLHFSIQKLALQQNMPVDTTMALIIHRIYQLRSFIHSKFLFPTIKKHEHSSSKQFRAAAPAQPLHRSLPACPEESFQNGTPGERYGGVILLPWQALHFRGRHDARLSRLSASGNPGGSRGGSQAYGHCLRPGR